MTYSPSGYPVLTMVHLFGEFSSIASVLTAAPASAVFESANRATYFPISLPATCVVRRLWWANGGTVSASYNVDCGIYADAGWKPGARLVSTGSTAQGTASEVQFVDVTDTTLPPGRYWLALAASSTSATFFRGSTNSTEIQLLKFSEASALPLPATASPAQALTAQVYLFGFATTASP